MVGRQAELDRLWAAWEDVAGQGSARIALVAGEPGIGKTRLAAEVAGRVDDQGFPVLVGACRRDAPGPYQPFLEALGAVLPGRADAWFARHAEHHGPALARLFPLVAERVPAGRRDEPAGPRSRFVGALVGAIHERCDVPVLLVLEDLQWATASTVRVVDHLARQRAPLLVIGTYCDSAVPPSHPLVRLLDDPTVPRPVRVHLEVLPPQAVATLLADRAAVTGPAAASLAGRLWRATEGLPLLLTEQIRQLAAVGALAAGSVDWHRIDEVGVAKDVAEMVERKLRTGGAQVRGVLEAAATVGPSFPADLVGDLAGQGDGVTRTALGRAVAASLVAPVGGRPGRYRFVHDAVRDAVYASMGVERQVRLHAELAALLLGPGRAGSTHPTVLLHHLAAAAPVGRSPDAVEHAAAAGRAAMDIFAFEEAADYFGQAVASLSGGDARAASRRCDLLMLLGEAYRQAGQPGRARQSHLLAAAIAHGQHDGPRLGRAVLGLGEALEVWGADALLIGLLGDALAANAADPSMEAKLLARLGQARAALDSPDQRKGHSDRAWERAWDSRDADTMGAVLRARHQALSAPDDLEDRIEIDGELVAMAMSGGDAELTLLAHGWRFVDLLEQGRVADADRDRKVHAAAAERSGEPGHQRDASRWAATRAMLAGHPQEAAASIDRALERAERNRDPDASAAYWTQQFALLYDWGTDDEVDALVDLWRDVVHSHDRAPVWRSSLALLLVQRGRYEEAAIEFEDVVAEEGADLALDRDWLPAVAALGEVAAALHDERALRLATLLTPYARRLIVVGPGLACRGSVGRVLGLLHASLGNWDQAERHFQAALTAQEAAGTAALVARTRSDFARALATKPGGPLHTGRVRATLDLAAKEAARCQMKRLAAQTRSAARRRA